VLTEKRVFGTVETSSNKQPKGRAQVVTAKRVLFICTGNSARSQMAEGLLRSLGGKEYEVFSAGTYPSLVRPQAIKVMSELGIDITGQYPKGLDQFVDREFDYVITVCDHAKESCPVFHGAKEMLHWSIEDPVNVWGTEEIQMQAFRKARDEIRNRIGRTFKLEQSARTASQSSKQG
jgi:arsenate reductase